MNENIDNALILDDNIALIYSDQFIRIRMYLLKDSGHSRYCWLSTFKLAEFPA